jgi:hypothetical protein
MRDDPIIVIGLPRSRTSMVAGTFAAHGVFVGTCKEADSRNAKGFFEHLGFADLVIELYGKGLISRNEVPEPHPDFKPRFMELMERDGYSGGPWLVKHAHVFYKVWQGFKPRFVIVKRDTESIAESAREVGWVNSISHITKGQKMLDRVAKEYGAPVVLTDEVVQGDYCSLREAFDYCGLVFNGWTASRFIDPSMTRFSPKSMDNDTSVVMHDKSYIEPNHRKGEKRA